MDFGKNYNTRSPGVKRLMKEAQEMMEPTESFSASPIDDNLFEWHFTIRGADETAFEGGVYHGRILFPTEYPMKPPHIVLLTPNGRFEINKKVCLSISGHHPETWQPSWSVRTALMALIAFMPVPNTGGIGGLDYPDDEKKKLAKKSRSWTCRDCGKILDLLAAPDSEKKNVNKSLTKEEGAIDVKDIVFKSVEEGNETKDENESKSETGTEADGDGENQINEEASSGSVSIMLSKILCSDIILVILVTLIAILLYRRIFLL